MNRNEAVSDLLSAPGAFPNGGEAVKRVPDGMCRRSESACRPADAIVVSVVNVCSGRFGVLRRSGRLGKMRGIRGQRKLWIPGPATCNCGILKPV